MRSLAALLGAALAVASLYAGAGDAADQEDWISLFNGHDLQGWTPKIRHHPAGENFANTFRVVDGLLTVSYADYGDFDGQYGHLFYNQPFSHYRLRLDYRFVGEHARGVEDWGIRNSGAMLHSQAPDTMPPEQDFPISVEFQFLGGLGDGKPRPTGSMCSPGTEVVIDGEMATTHCVTSTAPTFEGEQWVHAEALVLGSERVVHYINGQAVMEYGGITYGGGVVHDFRPEMKPDGESLGAGYIALQSEGHPIQFRNIELLNLKGCMDPQAQNYKRYFVVSDPTSCNY